MLSTERSAASAYPLEDPRKGELAEPAQKAVAGDAGGAKDFLSLVFGDAVASWAALVDAVAAANGLVSAEGLRAALRIAVKQDRDEIRADEIRAFLAYARSKKRCAWDRSKKRCVSNTSIRRALVRLDPPRDHLSVH